MSEPAGALKGDPAQATNYNSLDRLLHRIAYAHPKVQQTLADIEGDLFRKRLAPHRIDRPVFITGLPRAGTTLLLELLYGTGEFASYTYRQMPFVLAPMLWDRITRGSRQAAVEQQRAHGDGMSVSVDSPEAFEEVLWTHRLGKRLFRDGHQMPLSGADLTDEFRRDLKALMTKLVALAEERPSKSGPSPIGMRYLSKNNANLARLDALGDVFPDARILLCFRHPETHVASLCHQHDRFTRLHADDAFSRQYMAWTAHHDFGANFVPVDFHGRAPGQPQAGDQTYWLQYWIDAYSHVLEHLDDHVGLISYEALLEHPDSSLTALARCADLHSPKSLISQAQRLRSGGSRQLDLASLDPGLATRAQELYAELSRRAVNGASDRQSSVRQPSFS